MTGDDFGYGFEIIDPGNTGRKGGAQFGPFDDSPNGRDAFDDDCHDEIYDSFIGFKNFATPCALDDPDAPCSSEIIPEGGIFKMDVPNGGDIILLEVWKVDSREVPDQFTVEVNRSFEIEIGNNPDYLFGDGSARVTVERCMDAADSNNDEIVDISDAIRILAYFFGHTGPLADPVVCGPDPDGDTTLECEEYQPCED